MADALVQTANAVGLVRPVRPGDAAALARVLRASCQEAAFDTTALRASLERYRSGTQSIFVAENPQGRAVGFVAVAWVAGLSVGSRGVLAELVVHPRWRRQGLGGRLLAAVREEARRRHCCRLYAPALGPASPPDSFLAARGWQGRSACVPFGNATKGASSLRADRDPA